MCSTLILQINLHPLLNFETKNTGWRGGGQQFIDSIKLLSRKWCFYIHFHLLAWSVSCFGTSAFLDAIHFRAFGHLTICSPFSVALCELSWIALSHHLYHSIIADSGAKIAFYDHELFSYQFIRWSIALRGLIYNCGRNGPDIRPSFPLCKTATQNP